MRFRKLAAALAVAALAVLPGCAPQGEVEGQGAEGEVEAVEAPAAEAGDAAPLEVTRHGFGACGPEFASYAVEVTNPNGCLVLVAPSVRVTLRAEDGTVVGTDDAGCYAVFPGETLWLAGQVDTPVPAASMEVEPTGFSEALETDDGVTGFLEVSNVAVRDDGYGGTVVTGEVSNGSGDDQERARVDVAFLSGGEVVGGATAFAEHVPAGGSAPWEAAVHGLPAFDSHEESATVWS